MEDKHALFIPDDVVSQVLSLVNQAKGLLQPYVTPLTPAERHTLPKMGEKTLSFVEKAHEFAVQNPNLCPPYLDMTAFNTDFADVHSLLMLNNVTLQLHEYTDDTAMTSGSEAFQAALVFYNSVKMAARQNIPGAKAVYEELRKRFPNTRHKPVETDAKKSDETA
ncbi:MAG: hypothetical protein LBK58_08520 [Prevotellaceae bacterium]|jgi:hypothetical protein|nr:hypothetical protein [Prevotellaceae bacterium]